MSEFISYIFSLRISFFYDIKSNTSIFFKSYSFSEKQEKILAQLKRQLEKENLKIAVYASLKDNNMIITDEVVDENSFGKYIYNREKRGMDINEFYKVIKIDKEKIR